MSNQWDLRALKSRTKDSGKRTLHEAGAPNPEEIEAYGQCVLRRFGSDGMSCNDRCLVLGMTPALRGLAHRMGYDVTCLDRNPAAIAYFRDWGRPDEVARERVIEADWMDLPKVAGGPYAVVFGDGVFGNLLTVDEHRHLLATLKQSLAAGGVMVFRKIMLPRGFPVADHRAERLVEAFRVGRLSEAEFGFAMRIWGSHDLAYESATHLLDNARLFARYGRWRDEGRLSGDEHEIVERYYFGGLNLIPQQDLWEALLTEQGLAFDHRPLSGKAWHPYYPLYACWPAD